jgi:signal transduction histidine kinase
MALAVAYFLGAVLAFTVGTLSDKVFAPFWPPNVILFAALFFTPPARWPVLVLATLPAHVAAEVLVGMGPMQMAVAFATNCLVAVVNAALARRLIGPRNVFADLRRTFIYLAAMVALVPALSAFAGAFVQVSGGGRLSSYWSFWFDWFASNALGFLVLGPLLLIWLQPEALRSLSIKAADSKEALLVAAGLVIASIVSVWVGTHYLAGWAAAVAYLYLPLPFKLWAAVRFGHRGASAAVLVAAMVTIWAAMNGSTVFLAGGIEDTVRAVQIVLSVDAVALLLLGVSIDQLHSYQRENRRIGHHLLHAADEERRRIARELHDNIGQQLQAAVFMIDRDRRSRVPSEPSGSPEDVRSLLQDTMRQVRTVSYLLHPPLLDEGGLRLATENYVAGFVERSGIVIELNFPREMVSIDKDVELALFRVMQEALSNIARHSGAKSARIALEHVPERGAVILTVEDRGKGISGLSGDRILIESANAVRFAKGLGLRSLAERVSQVGGSVEISSRVGRTVLRASVPASKIGQLATPRMQWRGPTAPFGPPPGR